MLSFPCVLMLLAALAALVAACRAIAQAFFAPQSDNMSVRIALLWCALSLALAIVVPALDRLRASWTAAASSAALLAAGAAATLFLSRRGREAAMAQEVEKLHAARDVGAAPLKSAASATDSANAAATGAAAAAAPVAALDLETLCARAARTYDLTRREEDVLRLLAEGRTAAQVADQLVVSPNTVKTHVRNLYRKLGITRRDDLASRLGR